MTVITALDQNYGNKHHKNVKQSHSLHLVWRHVARLHFLFCCSGC